MDEHWQRTAMELILLLQSHAGQSQAAWQQALERYVGDRMDYQVIRGLAKVLTDAATFTPQMTPTSPTVLRERLFSYGPVFSHPDVFHSQTRQEVIQNVATEFSLSFEVTHFHHQNSYSFVPHAVSKYIIPRKSSCIISSSISS